MNEHPFGERIASLETSVDSIEKALDTMTMEVKKICLTIATWKGSFFAGLFCANIFGACASELLHHYWK